MTTQLADLLKPGHLLVIKTDGTFQYMSPSEETFSLEELYETIKMPEYGDEVAIETCPIEVKGHVVIAHESGVLMGLPLNVHAERLLRPYNGEKSYSGNVVIIPEKLFD